MICPTCLGSLPLLMIRKRVYCCQQCRQKAARVRRIVRRCA